MGKCKGLIKSISGMNERDADLWRARLETLRDELAEEAARGVQGTATVTLDQQAVGRLSRMDALQSQAMAQASQQRRSLRLAAIGAALQRIEEGEFGYCSDCGEDIAPARLEHDPTVTRCISCARG